MPDVRSRDWGEELAEIRRSRRHPRRTDFDYLHIRQLVRDLQRAIDSLAAPPADVLDVWCGSRPYDDLLPAEAKCIGLDVNDDYGIADVVSEEFLPFPDGAFDLVMSIEAFHYHPDPVAGAREIMRVLRPGGTAIVAVPFAWEYDPAVSEHRFTEPELRALFGAFDVLDVVENGGIGVSWATVTNLIVKRAAALAPAGPLGLPVRLAAKCAFVGVGLVGELIERAASGRGRQARTLPMNLLITARKPIDER